MSTKLTTQNFNDEVKKSDKVIVDFYSDSCGPCRMLAPVLEELEKELSDKVSICKVDVADQDGLAADYSVMGIPTLILFENGEPTKKIVGFRSKEAIISEFEL